MAAPEPSHSDTVRLIKRPASEYAIYQFVREASAHADPPNGTIVAYPPAQAAVGLFVNRPTESPIETVAPAAISDAAGYPVLRQRLPAVTIPCGRRGIRDWLRPKVVSLFLNEYRRSFNSTS